MDRPDPHHGQEHQKDLHKPELRERIKAEVMAGDKGARPGQWSARKAQLVAHEYEAAGGGYVGEKTDAQKHLHQWTDEHWQTADGQPAIDGETTHRYLPKEAWDQLTPEQKEATEQQKEAGSLHGEQFVPNTPAAKQARKTATKKSAKRISKRSAAKRPATKSGRTTKTASARKT